MSAFQDMLAADLHGVYLNPDEFAERRTVRLNGECFEDIPIVLTGRKLQERGQRAGDYGQGLFLGTSILHCALSDLGGIQPEKGQRMEISEPGEPGEDMFFRAFYVRMSDCEMGMVQAELEEIDE